MYAVVYQESKTSQGLLTAKAQLSKKGLTIPILVFVAHMAANLVNNVRNALEGYAVRSVYGWTSGMAALHWISSQGKYKQFVSNRVAQISAKNFINWRHDQNPADVGIRGTESKELLEIWLKGPDWLSTPDVWPALVQPKSSEESEAEAKLIKEVFAVATEPKDTLYLVLEKQKFWHAIRITSWVARFIYNCKSSKENHLSGPLMTQETDKQVKFWVNRTQHSKINTDQFHDDQLKLNLQKNEDSLYECRGRIQGSYPIYLPPDALLTERMVHDAHVLSVHGGVGLTMASIRQQYWVQRLRQLAKKSYPRLLRLQEIPSLRILKPICW